MSSNTGSINTALVGSPRPAGPVNLSFFKVLVLTPSASAGEFRNLLQALQIKSQILSSAEEALRLLDGERFDLLLVDFSDGQNFGAQTLQAIRGSQGSSRTIPALAVIASKDQASLLDGFDVQDVLMKPVSSEALNAKLQQAADHIFAALPVLQESSIDKIRMFDDEEQSLLTSLFEIYTESTGGELVEIEQLVKDADFEMLRKKAHKLKSSAAQLGAFRFEKYCNLMEYEPELTQERAQQLYEKMLAEYARSLKEFDLYCRKHANA
jgi:CheY-like chemotaxis protein/HPt (histidine-containing phosphotransfer) domain-containing protein